MSDRDNKLLDVVNDLGLNKEEGVSTELIVEEQVNVNDVSDLIEKKNKRVLTNQDYLILTDLSSSKGIETLSTNYGVTQNYIKKLMRSDSGNEFLQEQAKQKSEIALALSTTTVAEGVMKYQQMIDELFAKGQTQLALNYLFGKQSLSEIQATLHKQQAGIVEDGGDKLLDLFANLAVGNNNGK